MSMQTIKNINDIDDIGDSAKISTRGFAGMYLLILLFIFCLGIGIYIVVKIVFTPAVPPAVPNDTVKDTSVILQNNAQNIPPGIVFKSKLLTNFSFDYDQGSTVIEKNMGKSTIFTITDTLGRQILITYEKEPTGCFDPINSFPVSKNTILDYRFLYPLQGINLKINHPAVRSDEEIGSYELTAGETGIIGAESAPYIYSSNICVRTSVPTSIQVVSTSYFWGQKAELKGSIDRIVGSMKI